MASIIKKIKKGHAYYYAVESARVDGKPRIVWQKYLGTVQSIVKRADMLTPPKPKHSVISEFGAVAALLCIAQRIGVVEIIDRLFPKRDQGPSVGQYILLAAINRAVEPLSKSKIAQWYDRTILRRLWKFSPKEFSSQRFWDHMDRVDQASLPIVQHDITRSVLSQFEIDLSCLFYDTTNFFTYIDTHNDRCSIAQRGKSKARRDNLRQIGLALLVSGEFHIPLLHYVYPGNQNDRTQFKTNCRKLSQSLERIHGKSTDVTLVFDKGNHSPQGFQDLFSTDLHFVSSLVPSHFPQLLDIPLDKYQPVQTQRAGLKAYRTQQEILGRKLTVVITFSETFFSQQLAAITAQVTKSIEKLRNISQSLYDWQTGKKKGKKPTKKSVDTNVRRILSPQHMTKLIHVDISSQKGLPLLNFSTNHNALQYLTQNVLGKTLLFTDNHHWTTQQIITAYRGQSNIEQAFKQMNNLDFLHFRPQFHWTDSKIKVHAFCCVLALTLTAALRRQLAQNDIETSTHQMLSTLANIRQVATIYPPGTLGQRKNHIHLSRTSKLQKQLIQILDLQQFLPTDG